MPTAIKPQAGTGIEAPAEDVVDARVGVRAGDVEGRTGKNVRSLRVEHVVDTDKELIVLGRREARLRVEVELAPHEDIVIAKAEAFEEDVSSYDLPM